MDQEIIERVSRKIEIDKGRILLSPEALTQLGITAGDNEVFVTTYENMIVITKRAKKEEK